MINRRQWLGTASTLALGALAACGGGAGPDTTEATLATGPDASAAGSRKPVPDTRYAAPVQPKARVIVVGGGMAGATAAKYLRMWGDAIDVMLVDRSATYTSCIMSSLVLTGQRQLSSLNYGYDTLRSRYGVRTVFDDVLAIDPVAASVRLASGSVLKADRIVLAPGIAFDDTPGLNGPGADPDAMPHAWKAGPQTTVLAGQLGAMPSGGVVVLTIPKAPYRCPPGPYERACLLADWIKRNKPRGKLIVLDANPDFVTEKDNFGSAFFGLHGAVIEYRTNVVIEHVDTVTRTLFTNTGAVRGDVVNLIPTQRAPDLLKATGLLNDASARFAKVNVLDYASTAAAKVHVIGDASATTQPKAGHVANQEAKVLADALARIFAGGQPDPAPVTNSACYSTITMSQASWLHALFQYDPPSGNMAAVAGATGASAGWDSDNFEQMQTWFKALMADTFA
jgi:sulfide dehydrogenase [flavocytochrome c] flavoprotein chain